MELYDDYNFLGDANKNITDDVKDKLMAAVKAALKYWPSHGLMKSMRFRIKTSQNIFTPCRVFTYLTNSENWYGTRVTHLYGAADVCSTFAESMHEGIIASDQANDKTLSSEEWITYKITFSSTSMIINVSDGKNKIIYHGDYRPGGRVAFGFISSYKYAGYDAYIDDVKVSFDTQPGGFDTNEPVSDIDLWYSGNTFLNPDDTAILTGNKLYDTVDNNISIETVPSADKSLLKNPDNKISVVEQESYSDTGKNYSSFVQTANHYFNPSTAIPAKVEQRSGININMVIRSSLQKGVYAVQLNSKIDGSKKTIYINRPIISFVTGDEGNVATRGGTIRIIGNNLVPSGVADDVTVRHISKSDGKNYVIPVTGIYANDAYSLSSAIPANMPYGEYEVYVHNGYGDNTAWSNVSTITIGKSPRDSWGKSQFNVMDYGAIGDGQTNDTPAIVSAFDAAAANGGGTVYLPRGTYRVVTTLAIPQYVTLKGDGQDLTMILFTASRWQYGEVPDTLVSIIGNTEICDLSLYGTRCKSIISVNDDGNVSKYSRKENRDNVYIKNVKIRFTPGAGSPSGGGAFGVSTDALKASEIFSLIKSERASRSDLDFTAGTNNLQLDGMRLEIQNEFVTGVTMRVFYEQLQIRNCYWAGYSLASSSHGAIVEDNELVGAGLILVETDSTLLGTIVMTAG